MLSLLFLIAEQREGRGEEGMILHKLRPRHWLQLRDGNAPAEACTFAREETPHARTARQAGSVSICQPDPTVVPPLLTPSPRVPGFVHVASL